MVYHWEYHQEQIGLNPLFLIAIHSVEIDGEYRNRYFYQRKEMVESI